MASLSTPLTLCCDSTHCCTTPNYLFFKIVFVSPESFALIYLLAQLVCRIILFDINSINHLLCFKWFISLKLLWCLFLIPLCNFAQTDRQDNGRVGNRHKYENKRMGRNSGERCFTPVAVYGFSRSCVLHILSVYRND